MTERIIIDIMLLASILLLPWWVSMLLVLGAMFYFNAFYEAVLLGFAFDSLYSNTLAQFFSFQFVFTLMATVLVYTLELLKRQLMSYPFR